ncbi:hypothetical protein BJY01DRAFT_257973 [Aspergillus pseudoustus]|uniref:BTB domain-containing protein n=1 Tax=Aspergillus pseudoustus TaxID=1810923 RepID=A0ABR4JF23_9EURO
MDHPTHILDPDGEVVIVLQDANSPFADPEEYMDCGLLEKSAYADVEHDTKETGTSEQYNSVGITSDAGGGRGSKKKRRKKKTMNKKKATNIPREPPPPLTEESVPPPTPSPDDDPFAQRPATHTEDESQPAQAPAADIDNEPGESRIQAGSPEEECFRIQVSAKHLLVSSAFFNELLTGKWKESVTYLEKRSVEVTATDWDIDALLILLRVIHHQHYQIPRVLSLEMLAKVALLADYYQCEETVSVWATTWIDALEETIPTMYCRELFLWIWVSWYFKLQEKFKEATSRAMSWSPGRLSSLGLIPAPVIDAMNSRREEVIGLAITTLHETREAFLNESQGCSFECSSIMYGALTKELRSNGLLSPRPAAPFDGLRHRVLVERMSHFQSPCWATYNRYGCLHGCSTSSFSTMFRHLVVPIEGLQQDQL